MGEVISARYISKRGIQGLLKPIIYCGSYVDGIADAVSLNKAIAERLIAVEPSLRSIMVEKAFREVMATLPDNVTICSFDVLFHPAYKIDVLRMMTTVCKTKSFSVIWPGKLIGHKLVYAEEGCPDYKEYNINDYDITCIR